MKPTSSTTDKATLMARKALLKRIHRQELKRLQAMVPKVAKSHPGTVDTVTIIEEAISYISQLHQELLDRIRDGTLSDEAMKKLNPDQLQRLHLQLTTTATANPSRQAGILSEVNIPALIQFRPPM